jgi:hypothetical protein
MSSIVADLDVGTKIDRLRNTEDKELPVPVDLI